MRIIIDIDEKDKRYMDRVIDNSSLAKPTVNAILNAVRNGTPLPDVTDKQISDAQKEE